MTTLILCSSALLIDAVAIRKMSLQRGERAKYDIFLRQMIWKYIRLTHVFSIKHPNTRIILFVLCNDGRFDEPAKRKKLLFNS